MDRDFIENAGWRLVASGLMLIGLTALLALVRADGDPWQAFAWLYGIAWAMIFIGFRLLRRVGAWPVSS